MSALDKPKDLGPAPGTGFTFAAFAADEATRQALTEVAQQHWHGALIASGGLQEAIEHLSNNPSPQLLAIDVGDNENPIQSVQELAEHCGPDTEVVVIGTVNDVTLYRDLLNAGVADYLVKPVTVELLEDALMAAALRPAQLAFDEIGPEELGTIVCVIGARGGAGASTIAVNAAWLMAEEWKKKVALIDLDINYGTAALSLDLVPSDGLIEVLQHPERVDGLFLASSMLAKSDNFSVLACEHELSEDVKFDADALEIMLLEMQRTFEWVWVDVPRDFCHGNASVLAAATRIILVSDLSLAGMRDSKRLLDYCQLMAEKAQISVLLNRVGGDRSGGLNVKQFERGFQKSVEFQLRDDPAAAGAAASGGQPVAKISAKGKLTRDLRDFVGAILGEEAPRRGLFRRRVPEPVQ